MKEYKISKHSFTPKQSSDDILKLEKLKDTIISSGHTYDVQTYAKINIDLSNHFFKLYNL